MYYCCQCLIFFLKDVSKKENNHSDVCPVCCGKVTRKLFISETGLINGGKDILDYYRIKKTVRFQCGLPTSGECQYPHNDNNNVYFYRILEESINVDQ